ncbi:MAG: peptidase M23, partial [Rhodocyclaceae bacterium]|nr:peptidase M23 [Rhodocyclaceae bacterium]
VQDEIAALDAQSKEISARSAAQQQMLGRLLRHQFARGEADALRLLLAGEDPNQNARDRHFLTLLSQTRAEIIGKLREAQVEKQQLAVAAKERQFELEKIEARQKEQREGLVAQQKQRQAMLVKIADRIRGQRKELGALKRDEQRLTNLIAQLAKIASRPKKAKAQRPASNGRSEPPRLHNEHVPQPGGDGSDFAALKGRLRLPVKGDIANRFGTPRAEGGATWKGLFIRAGEGSEVRTVASGRVVFSDWLRGFGNLLIVDHDDGYLSVYGNNQSLYRQPGDTVKAGEAIAAAGNSGGNAESGLYFELRFQGQAFDPLKWVSLR